MFETLFYLEKNIVNYHGLPDFLMFVPVLVTQTASFPMRLWLFMKTATIYSIEKKKEPHARHPRTRIYINNHSTTKTNLELFFQLMKSTIFCTFTSCSSFQLALCLDLYGSNQSRCAIFWGRKKTHRGHAGCCPLHREEVSPAEGRAVERKNNLLIMTSN